MTGMSELDSLRSAALPTPGARYAWEPLKEHAAVNVVVLSVTWNGEEYWVDAIGEDDGRSYKNDLARWVEATVLVAPRPDGQSDIASTDSETR